ncbi:MAG TPA: hypothetical protein VM370_10335 [Candidatus Thermoplasmatota archaeon]|nr:hypothetical protein [Candidatus Thermoplasmatota archaeon]
MRPGTKLFLTGSLAFAAGIAITIWFERMYAADGFLKNSLDAALMPPITATKILIVVTALVVFTALPLGIAEWNSERRFVRAERELRALRPVDQVARYEGPEGRGFLFEGPEGRLLLLEPAGGIGEPRRIELPPAPMVEPEQAPIGVPDA